jgi:hypothetical protein
MSSRGPEWDTRRPSGMRERESSGCGRVCLIRQTRFACPSALCDWRDTPLAHYIHTRLHVLGVAPPMVGREPDTARKEWVVVVVHTKSKPGNVVLTMSAHQGDERAVSVGR